MWQQFAFQFSKPLLLGFCSNNVWQHSSSELQIVLLPDLALQQFSLYAAKPEAPDGYFARFK